MTSKRSKLRGSCTEFDALIEEIDIGGPTLVRAAAKNFQDVLIVVDPSDYREAMEQLDRESGPSADFRLPSLLGEHPEG